MLELRPSKAEEISAQKALWQKAFGDDEDYIDEFYRHCALPEDVLVLLEDGVLRSMLALLPVAVTLPDGESIPSFYVYALATDPEVRKQGFGRMLLEYADFYLKEQGVDCVTVVPAEASLHKFFGTVGFQECFATRKIELPARDVATADPGDRVTSIEAEEYAVLREKALEGTLHAAYGERLLDYQRRVCLASGGDLLRLDTGGAVGCAAVEKARSGSVVVKELLIDPAHVPVALSAIAAHFPAERYHLRTPAFWSGHPTSYVQPFAMVKWLSGQLRRAQGEESMGYFGLAFD